MTSFLTQNIGGPVIGSMVSADKGDISNRVNCAGSQLKNNVSTLIQDTVVIGGAAGAAKVVSKSPRRIVQAAQYFDKAVKTIGKHFGSNPLFEKLLSMSKKSKAAALIGVPAGLLLNFIIGKHIYKMGQIDQRYTDKAKLEAHTKDQIL